MVVMAYRDDRRALLDRLASQMYVDEKTHQYIAALAAAARRSRCRRQVIPRAALDAVEVR
jgi:hypothetical protein